MTDLQVLLDARGATPEELAAAADTLLLSVPALEVVGADGTQAALVADRCGDRAAVLDAGAVVLRRDVPVLVAPGAAAYARGAVRRLLADLATPGRLLTCVLVPAEDAGRRVACWSPRWLAGYAGSLEDLLDADLGFDRRHLPAGSPRARAWLRADVVGVAPVTQAGPDPVRWARATGLRLDRSAAVAGVRAPLGAARRRAARWRQRRAAPSVGQPAR